MRLLLLLVPLALALTHPLPAAPVFVAPDGGNALFQRDLLPLDTDTMRSLSAHLGELARREIAEGPEQFRATAQLLAIAIRLDPANRAARELALSLAKGTPALASESDLDKALGQSWGITEWLLQEEAGAAGQLLGNQLLDALRVLDPRNPNSTRHDPGGETARWKGVVPSLARFKNEPPPKSKPSPPKPKPPPPPVDRPPILLAKTSTQTPLYLYDRDLHQHLRIARVSMEVVNRDEGALFTFALRPEFEAPIVDTARERVRGSLQRTWPDLPIHSVALLDTGAERYASRNETAISGPASLLMHAALSGKALRDDVVFLGDLKSDGRLTRPRQSWNYLRALRLAKGGRLLVPPDLQPGLRAMIAMEDPGFFLKWEVLVVSSLDVALSLASVAGDPEGLAATSQLFVELRGISKGKDVGQLCVNKHVRQRLVEIQSQAPFHFSSSMLLVQGTSERPTRVDREVAGRILRSAVDPLTSLTRTPLKKLSVNRIVAIGEATRSEIDRFSKYFAPKDLDLQREALQLAKLAELVARSKRDGVLDSEGNITYRGVPVLTHYQGLQTKFSAFLKKLAPFTRESFPPPSKKVQKTS